MSEKENKKEYDVYKLIQQSIIVVTIIITLAIIFSRDYKNLAILKYVNPISFIASVELLLITMVNKIKLDESIIVTDRDRHTGVTYKVINFIFIISVLVITLLFLNLLPIADKVNDILGIISLCIALSTEIIATYIVSKMLHKSRIKFKKRYNDLYR